MIYILVEFKIIVLMGNSMNKLKLSNHGDTIIHTRKVRYLILSMALYDKKQVFWAWRDFFQISGSHRYKKLNLYLYSYIERFDWHLTFMLVCIDDFRLSIGSIVA